MPAGGEEDDTSPSLGTRIRKAQRVGKYISAELGHDAGLIGIELVAGFSGVVALGLYEGSLVLPQQRLRYALWTSLPSLAGGGGGGGGMSVDAVVRGLLNLPGGTTAGGGGAGGGARAGLGASQEALLKGTSVLRLRNVQAGRQLVALATVVGVAVQVSSSIQRGREAYKQNVAEGREPPLAAPQAVRLSHRSGSDGSGGGSTLAPAFHVAVARDAEDVVPSSKGTSLFPRRWWTRAGWIQDPREWRQLLAGASYSKSNPLFLEAEVVGGGEEEKRQTTIQTPTLIAQGAQSRPQARAGALSLDLALQSLRAGGWAAAGTSGSIHPNPPTHTTATENDKNIIRILLAGSEALRPLTRRTIEESGAVDVLIDGEAAVAMAVLAWMEKTPYATAWAALAAQRTREEEAQISARREGNPTLWKGYEHLNTYLETIPVSEKIEKPWRWLTHTFEGLGRRLRWLVKGGVTARDALEEYKVVILVHDADTYTQTQRTKLKETLQGAGWDVWGPGKSTSKLVQDKDALVPVLVYCQDDATTLERARFLVRAGRPPQLTCALLEDPVRVSPWVGKGGEGGGVDEPTVVSVADVHESIFGFVRSRVKEGKRSVGEVQREIDLSIGYGVKGGGKRK